MKILGFVCNVQHKMPHGTHESNACLYPLWSIVFICNGNCETKYLYFPGRTYRYFKKKWSYRYFILPSQRWIIFAVRNKQTPNKETPLSTYRAVYINTIFINIHKHTHVYMFSVNEVKKLWSFSIHSFPLFIIISLSHIQIIFCLPPLHQIPKRKHMLKSLALKDSRCVTGWISR